MNKNKTIFFILILALVFLSFLIIKQDKEGDNVEVQKEQNPLEPFLWKIEVKKSEETEKYKIDFEYPVFTDEGSVSKKINEQIGKLVEDVTSSAKNDFESIMKDGIMDERGDDLTLLAKFNISDNNKFGVLNVMYEIYTYSGGAHGITSVNYIVFDKTNGSELKLGDVFNSKSSALEKLSDLSMKEIKRIDPDLEIYNQVEEGASPKVQNFENFALDPAGFKIKFSDYQIGPYVAGRLEIVLPYEDLKDVLNERFAK